MAAVKQTGKLDEYKFAGAQLMLSDIAVVEAQFNDGSKRLVHLAKDERGAWKLFWNNQTGIE